ncbi:MAG TPA: bifunctional 5,10-methylenetetrahydrofolate dehydrogenase/5,10-methenyltetrahydrofolate cyclohydrolase [Polyangiales bacterium]|nr:bifunctional 5,10-methylenetetrahydrofolate dehydrogenase/5,10-methenyltetrahydrofolate cyclohydrolase [Polyangiales bacterium]
MSAQRIDGKAIGQKVRQEVASRAAAFAAERGRPPGLALLVVGDQAGSVQHVRNKARAGQSVGIAAQAEQLPAGIAEAELIARVGELNRAPEIDGILVQLPLPEHLDPMRVLAAIDPHKDVDALTPENAGLLALGKPRFVPCTPLGCMRLLDEIAYELAGERALVIGRSNLVGKPLALLLLARHATVTLAHSQSLDLADLIAQADVLVSAAGRANLVRGEWVKPGAVVIDVGQNYEEGGKLCGDIEASAAERASWITPVPGGVGPMTIAMLLWNTLEAATSR